MQREATGVIVDDPAHGMAAGDALHFNAVPVFPQDEVNAAWLENWETQEGVLLSIHFRGMFDHRIEGSAVMVAPGIALCATHGFYPVSTDGWVKSLKAWSLASSLRWMSGLWNRSM